MTYKIKEGKANELKDGRTNTYLANKIGSTQQYIGKIFLGIKNCSKPMALLLISLCQKINIDSIDDDTIKIYFDEIKK
jgi:hypothetical protein